MFVFRNKGDGIGFDVFDADMGREFDDTAMRLSKEERDLGACDGGFGVRGGRGGLGC